MTHDQHECWICTELIGVEIAKAGPKVPISADIGAESSQSEDLSRQRPCARVFYERSNYERHLHQQHDIRDQNVVEKRGEKAQLGNMGQKNFWCGFCERIVGLSKIGLGK